MAMTTGAPAGTIRQIAQSLNFAHQTGQLAFFNPNNISIATQGDIRAIILHLDGSGTASGASTNVQGLLGAIANLLLYDKNNKLRNRWLGPQLAYWHWLKLRKKNASPSVSAAGAGAITKETWIARIPVHLPSSGAPYVMKSTAAPYSEISSALSAWTSNYSLYAEYGPVAGNGEIEDFIPLPNGLSTATGGNDLTQTVPLGVRYQNLAFVLNADSDFNYYTLEQGKTQIYEQLDADYFQTAAFATDAASDFASDNRPSGLYPIPYGPYTRSSADKIVLALNAVNNTAPAGVNVGDAYNPYAWLTRQLL